jgi:ferredoxin
VSALRAFGGKIIKVVRIDLPARENEHSSERAVDLIEPDLLLGVRTGDLRLVDRAAKLVALNKFSATRALDYRYVEPALRRYAGGMSAEDTARLLGQKSPYTVYFLVDYYGIPSRAKVAAQRVQHQYHDGVERKWCPKCASWRLLDEFNSSVRTWDRCSGRCSACTRMCSSAYDYSMRGMYKRMMRNAVTRGLGWALSSEDVEALWTRQRGLCAYTGAKMTFMPNDPNKVSLDRVDSTKGYDRSNVVLCGARANIMKRDMSVSEFIAACAAVVRHAGTEVVEDHPADPGECLTGAEGAEET